MGDLCRFGPRAGSAAPPVFHGDRLRAARLFRGMTLEELGVRVAATRQYMHQLETTGRLPAPEMVEALAAALNVLSGFFALSPAAAVAPEHCHFRKQATTPQAIVQQVLARGALLDELVTAISAEVELPRVDFPQVPVLNLDDAEAAAEACRLHWRLGLSGPIRSMTRVVEAAGAVVTHFPGLSERVDALSMHRPRPIIVRSTAKDSVVRLRFDLAHEAGHLVMHQGIETGDRATEMQAHRFASAFLLPAAAFAREFPRCIHYLDWPGLYALKQRWGVSVRAIARRAYDLGMIDAAQYRTANVHLARTGQTKGEAGDNDGPWAEKPELLAAAVQTVEAEQPGETATLAARLGLGRAALEELLEFAPPEPPPRPRLVHERIHRGEVGE